MASRDLRTKRRFTVFSESWEELRRRNRSRAPRRSRAARPAAKHKLTMWERIKGDKYAAIALLLLAFGAGLAEIAGWPGWVLIAMAPVAAVVITMQVPGATWRRAALAGVGSLLAALGIATLGPSGATRSSLQGLTLTTHAPQKKQPAHHEPAFRIAPAGGKARDPVRVRRYVWAIVSDRSIRRFDGKTLKSLGPKVKVGPGVEHLIACAGQLLVTYGRGKIARIDTANWRVARRKSYGSVVDAGKRRTGQMVCAGEQVLVVRSLEAQIVPYALPGLEPGEPFSPAGRIDAAAMSGDVPYAAHSDLAAIYPLDLDARLSTGLIGTQPAPTMMLGLANGTVLVGHEASGCLGMVRSGVQTEVGAPWSMHGAPVAGAVGDRYGVVLTKTDAYLFDAETGELRGHAANLLAGLRVDGVQVANDRVVIGGLPSTSGFLVIAARAWEDPDSVGREPGCQEPDGRFTRRLPPWAGRS